MKKKRLSKTHKRETVGQTVYDNLHKQPDVTSLLEIAPDLKGKYWEDLKSIIVDAAKNFRSSFYVEIIFLREKLLQQMVLRSRFFARSSCPTPTYGQHVWRYDFANDELSFLWSLPFKDRAESLKRNPLLLSEDERSMLKLILDFEDGTLESIVRKLNNEDDITANLVLINNEKATS